MILSAVICRASQVHEKNNQGFEHFKEPMLKVLLVKVKYLNYFSTKHGFLIYFAKTV